MTKLLFLDVDGVLNSEDWFASPEGRKRAFNIFKKESHIDPVAVAHLNYIVDATQCSIVLSSTWRRFYDLADFLMILGQKGLSSRSHSAFIGNTPVLDGKHGRLYTAPPRGEEIQTFINANPQWAGANIVILDDDSDMGALRPHLVQTHPIHGLTKDKADEVIQRLNLVPQLV